MIKLIILIAIGYILPAILAWRYIRISYLPKGVLYGDTPEGRDMFNTLCPVVNILFITAWLFDDPYKDHHFSNKIVNLFSKINIFIPKKFFNIK